MVETWPVSGHDPAHTGHGRTVTRPEGPVHERWRHGFDGKFAYHAPVVGEVFGRAVAFVDVRMTQVLAPTVRAVGPDGGLVWALRTGHGYGRGGSPAVADGTAYVAGTMREGAARIVDDGLRPEYDDWGHLHAFDATDGRVLWVTEFDTPVRGAPTVVADGRVFVLDADGRLRTFDAVDGETGWTADLGGRDVAGRRPAVAEGRVVLAGEGRTLLALDAADGRERWRVDLGERLGTGPVVANSRLYVAGYDLYCLEVSG